MSISPPKQVYRKPQEDWQREIIKNAVETSDLALRWYSDGAKPEDDSALGLYRSALANRCFDDMMAKERETKFNDLTEADKPKVIAHVERHITKLKELLN